MDNSETRHKQELINRLRSISGHVQGIARMIEDDAYCIEVIQQVQAVQAALNKVSIIVLDDHMHHCVTQAIRGDDEAERERVLDEIRDLFQFRSKL